MVTVSQLCLQSGASLRRHRHAWAPRHCRLSCEQAARPTVEGERKRVHVPTEVSELLVDALESHGCCVYVCGLVWEGIAVVAVERVGVEELKWDVCAGKAVS